MLYVFSKLKAKQLPAVICLALSVGAMGCRGGGGGGGEVLSQLLLLQAVTSRRSV